MGGTKIRVSIKRLLGNTDLPLPDYQSESAVGMDIHAAVDGELVINPGAIVSVPCGFSVAIPEGYEGQVRPRSGLAAKHGISVANSPGTIDPDYRGEIKVILINNGAQEFRVKRGMRIAQMLILPVPRAEWQEVEDLPPTARSDGGFGHTGE
jgi:dUTP pyrophosphatase